MAHLVGLVIDELLVEIVRPIEYAAEEHTHLPRVTKGSMVRRACHVSPREVW